MKRLSLQFAAVFGLMGALCLLTALPGQGKAAAARGSQPAGPTKVAVVDMSYLFQHYEKLEHLRESVKAAAEDAQKKAKSYIDQAKSIEEQLKSGEFENGSQEFVERENKVIQLSSRFETFKVSAQKDLKKKDAQVLLAVYEDIRHALDLYAEQNGYSLVLQINRDITASEEKSKVSQKLGQPVFRNQAADDITEGVLAYLSQAYEAESGEKPRQPETAKAPRTMTPPRTAAAPASPRSAAAPARTKAPRK